MKKEERHPDTSSSPQPTTTTEEEEAGEVEEKEEDGNGITSKETYEQKLLNVLEEIKPDRLESTSHIKYVKTIKECIKTCLLYDGSFFLLLVQAIKECKRACYKRDVLIEALDLIIFSDNILLTKLLCDPFQNSSSSSNVPWKELSNSVVSLPDLIANCDALKKLNRFKPEDYYKHLLTTLYKALSNSKVIIRRDEIDWFHVQILGRIAVTGFNQLVFDIFTSRLILDKREAFKNNVAHMFTIPLDQDNQVATHFEIFIEPLYVPIFFNLTPTSNTGELIKTVLGDKIINHESFNYIICNKSILQKNYTHSRRRQSIILFNIFSYLSCLVEDKQKIGQSLKLHDERKKSRLIETLLEVAECWSNTTRILFRSYEQNRFITCAFIIALRHALEYDKPGLLDCTEKIHSMIVKGFPIYLNRASGELRNLVMCLGEIVLPKLHQLIDERQGRDVRCKSRENMDVDFDAKWDESCLEMKGLFESDIEKLFCVNNNTDYCEVDNKKGDSGKHSYAHEENSLKSISEYSRTDRDEEKAKEKQPVVTHVNNKAKQRVPTEGGSAGLVSAVVKDKAEGKEEGRDDDNNVDRENDINISTNITDNNDDDDDDLIPYNLEDIDANEYDHDSDDNGDVGEDCTNVPIYLRDCINGLAENNKPRYVRICLIKAGELIRSSLLEQQEAMDDKRALEGRISGFQQLSAQSCRAANQLVDYKRSVKPTVNDEIRDIALELSQVLLYLDDQFHIDNFDALRIKALSFLCVGAPDLVVKYLLDKFNESCGSTRQQLDILQVLVASAQQLSSSLKAGGVGSEIDMMFGGGGGGVIGGGGDDVSSVATAGKIVAGGAAKIRGGTMINKFVRYAPLYFYGIVHRLKANLDNSSLPSTIVSAVKSAMEDSTTGTAAKGETLIKRVLAGLAKTKSQLGSFEHRAEATGGSLAAPIKAAIDGTGGVSSSRVVVVLEENYEDDGGGGGNDDHVKDRRRADNKAINEDSRISTDEPEGGAQQRRTQKRIDDGSDLKRQDTSSFGCYEIDDSYLLSRILFSVSLIIKCLHQQPITCKLSNDLLDILAAYRDHPDSGVRASINACLSAVRLCTPRVYFQEYLSEKTMCLLSNR